MKKTLLKSSVRNRSEQVRISKRKIASDPVSALDTDLNGRFRLLLLLFLSLADSTQQPLKMCKDGHQNVNDEDNKSRN